MAKIISITASDNIPVNDFCGLTPLQMHHLLFIPFTDRSIVKFGSSIDDSLLEHIPFFRLCEALLKIIQRDKFLKLTQLEFLPRKTVQELYKDGFIRDPDIEAGLKKPLNEADLPAILSADITLRHSGLTKKVHGKLSLTKEGAKLLEPKNRLDLFYVIFDGYTQKFSWAYNDGYDDDRVGQFGFAFTLYLLHLFGDQKHFLGFYSSKYLQAFPKLILNFPEDIYSTPIQRFNHCYSIRSFEQFLEWFGLVEIHREGMFTDEETDTVIRTDIFEKVFSFI